jgi:cytochrome c-type protein NapC
MFGTIVTKAAGLRHVWRYLTEYRRTTLEDAKKTIRLREPQRMNDNCMQCHSTRDTLWLKVPDHKASLADERAGRVGCASEGCHGLAHPFFRPPKEAGWQAMSTRRARRLLTVACVSALGAIGLMT